MDLLIVLLLLQRQVKIWSSFENKSIVRDVSCYTCSVKKSNHCLLYILNNALPFYCHFRRHYLVFQCSGDSSTSTFSFAVLFCNSNERCPLIRAFYSIANFESASHLRKASFWIRNRRSLSRCRFCRGKVECLAHEKRAIVSLEPAKNDFPKVFCEENVYDRVHRPQNAPHVTYNPVL